MHALFPHFMCNITLQAPYNSYRHDGAPSGTGTLSHRRLICHHGESLKTSVSVCHAASFVASTNSETFLEYIGSRERLSKAVLSRKAVMPWLKLIEQEPEMQVMCQARPEKLKQKAHLFQGSVLRCRWRYGVKWPST